MKKLHSTNIQQCQYQAPEREMKKLHSTDIQQCQYQAPEREMMKLYSCGDCRYEAYGTLAMFPGMLIPIITYPGNLDAGMSLQSLPPNQSF